MKKTYIIILMAFILTTLLNLSCKKEKRDCSFTSANVVGSYKISTIKYKASASAPEQDGTQFFESCELDDITSFNSNGTYTYTDAGVKCDPTGDGTGTWSVSGSNLVTDGDSAPVSNFSCSGFTISQTDIDTTGDVLSVTFKKQ